MVEKISEEYLDKWTKQDIELFKPINAMYPCLSSLKQKLSSIEQEKQPWVSSIEETVFEQLKSHYRLLGGIFEVSLQSGTLNSSALVIHGAIMRSLNTYRGALWALGSGNPHVFFDCLRSQCETSALLHYCSLKPEYIKTATIGSRNNPDKDLNIPSILTMVDKLDKKYNGVRKDYDQLCELVHPNPASLYASLQILDEKDKVVALTTQPKKLSDEQALIHMGMLIVWTKWIFDETLALAKIFYTKPA